jgi:hypothetical protein
MARHGRREKTNAANVLRQTTRRRRRSRPRRNDRISAKFAHIFNYVSYGGGVISQSSTEFGVAP